MIWIVALLWSGGSVCLGAPLAKQILSQEKRLAVHFAFSMVVGHCLLTVALLFLWSYLPLGTALFVGITAGVLVGAISACRSPQTWRVFGRWGIGLPDTILGALVSTGLFYLGYSVFTVAYLTSEAEALYWRAGLTAWLSHGLFPPTNPLEISDPLHYRHGLNIVAAAMASASNEEATLATAVVLGLLMSLAGIAFLAASCRLFGSVGPGVAAAILAVLGGSFLPYLRVPQVAAAGLDFNDYATELANGLLWSGNTLQMLQGNSTVAVELAAFAIAIWLSWETLNPDASGSRFARYLTAVAALTYLGVFSDVYFGALVVSLLAASLITNRQTSCRARVSSSFLRIVREAVVVGLALALLYNRQSLFGGMSPTGNQERAMGFVLNTNHFGSVVLPTIIHRLDGWFPLLSLDAFVDTNAILVGLPLLILTALRAGNSYALVGLLASVVSFGAWVLVYPALYPQSAYHFGNAAIESYIALAPIALASFLPVLRGQAQKILRILGATLLALAIAPSVIYAGWFLLLPHQQTQVFPGSSDLDACAYLRSSTSTSRVLVPTDRPDDGWRILYSLKGPGKSIREVVALGEHSVPIGFSPDFNNPTDTYSLYRQASLQFDEPSLKALQVDWVYVLPAYLTPGQRAALTEATTVGRLRLEKRFGEEGKSDERLLYAVRARQAEGSEFDRLPSAALLGQHQDAQRFQGW